MNLIENYLCEIREIRATRAGTVETAYYAALANLLDGTGKTLKPRVRCILQLQNLGAGNPDGGLFTADQFPKGSHEPAGAGIPSRGAIEVKGTADDAFATAEGEQVGRYLARYGQVLVTNYRDFVLMGRDAEGKPARLESYRLAESESAFWRQAADPRKMAAQLGESFQDFLKRAMLHQAALDSPKDLAWFLASYAREAKFRVEHGSTPGLASVRKALEEALGMKFEGEKGEHFFRSTLVQTLFYGIFSAWVLWAKQQPGRTARFEWGLADRHLNVPIVRKLFREVADPASMEAMGLTEVLDWAAAALNRVERGRFFETFQEKHAVQYFYEPFLEEFDPELRKELGVWYTPDEIVEYMVARADRVLREELGRPDGLADPDVYVLDPCCGTGAYLVAVLNRIAETLREKGGDALLAQDLKEAAMRRVFGFELLPAPFVVAHLQLGLLLQHWKAPFANRERAGVYLTNALTGWEPPVQPKGLPFLELEQERDAADVVKRDRTVLVILGNPPYNSFAGIAKVEDERGLSDAYRTVKEVPAPQGQGLNDLYVRFFRMAERRIVKTGEGVVCFISNYSWLDGLSFTGMRERYREVFDRIWVDNLNGDKYRTGKLTPEGLPDPSVFSTAFNREGIQVGTAISLLVRKREHPDAAEVRYRSLWGRAKREELLASKDHDGVTLYRNVEPVVALGLPFAPVAVETAYLSWPLLTELFPVFFAGVQTKRDDVVVDHNREALERRMQMYFDRSLADEEIARLMPRAIEVTARFDPKATREYLVKRGFKPEVLVRFCYRPFDLRWVYWEPETRLLGEKSPDYFPQVFTGNRWLIAQQKPRREWSRPQAVTSIACLDLMDRCASCIPQFVIKEGALVTERQPNLTERAGAYLSGAGATVEDLFAHVAAVTHAPSYAVENAGALRQDWPRIPLPAPHDILAASACLGRKVAALLDCEQTVAGVTTGAVRPDLRAIGVLSASMGSLDPAAGDLDITAGWGHAGKGGITMPAKGTLTERDYTPEERDAMGELAGLLGTTTFDVCLNGNAYWRNIPAAVWDYTLGGYQVIKKWLSYREKELLGRGITKDEARHVTEMARRIAALVAMGPALDANYKAVKRNPHPWKAQAAGA
jgi:hypothetical protein